jgi:hypothetical protein
VTALSGLVVGNGSGPDILSFNGTDAYLALPTATLTNAGQLRYNTVSGNLEFQNGGGVQTLSTSGNAILNQDTLQSGATFYVSSGTVAGALTAGTLDTGIGATEVYLMDQNLRQADTPTFAQLTTGIGLTEVYLMNQNLRNTDTVTFAQLTTGIGNTEVYLMDQNLRQADTVTFAQLTTGIGNTDVYLMDQNLRSTDAVQFATVTANTSLVVGNGSGPDSLSFNGTDAYLALPTAALTSAGQLRYNTASGNLEFQNGGGTQVLSPATGGGFTDGGAVVKTVTDADNVGIGTGTVNGKLHVASTGDQLVVEETDAAADEKKWLLKANNGDLELITADDAFGNFNAALQVNRTGFTVDRVVLPNGNVGVSTAVPTHRLAVAGGIVATSSITAQGGFYGDGTNLTGISAASLAAGSVGTTQIIDSTISVADMGQNSVGSFQIIDSTITSADIFDGTIAIGDLAFDPATQTELDAAVANLGANTVGTTQIIDSTITLADINTSDVDTRYVTTATFQNITGTKVFANAIASGNDTSFVRSGTTGRLGIYGADNGSTGGAGMEIYSTGIGFLQGNIQMWTHTNAGTTPGEFVLQKYDGTTFEERFKVTPTQVRVAQSTMVVTGGKVGVGTDVPASAFHVLNGSVTVSGTNAALVLGAVASAPSTPTDAVVFFSTETASNAEAYVLDEQGNATLISPHDKVTGEWIFYSKNVKTGRVVRVDMERLIRRLEAVLGEDFLQEYYAEPQ